MIVQGSRYEQADRDFSQAHTYDVYENAVYEDDTPPSLRFTVINRDTTYLVTTLPLPPMPPAEYYVKDRETLPFLGFKFLEDSREWWRISEVNPNIWYPLDIRAGTYLRIPS